MPLRVYNNSTITGLAARGAADFEAAGWTVTDTGGYNGRIPVSTVYYREGTAEKDAADFLADAFGLRAQPRFDGIEDSSPGVIVILTKDYQGA
ncbi:MAG: LytR C-terminal domain-containing protein [Pseudonocardia sp.]|nr:LytR C-terminal domain-containing protein [Pseudonocardia sp.]